MIADPQSIQEEFPALPPRQGSRLLQVCPSPGHLRCSSCRQTGNRDPGKGRGQLAIQMHLRGQPSAVRPAKTAGVELGAGF